MASPNLERELRLMTAVTATNGAPSIANETVGFPRPFPADQGVICVWSSAGSGTMTAGVRLWGYQTNLDRWFDLGLLNSGTDIPESAADTISYAEGMAGLFAFDRFYAELATVGGTSTAVNVALVLRRCEAITTS